LTEDDRTHLLFSLLDGLRLIIPHFSRDASTTDRYHRVLIPGVYYVFYKPPVSAAAKPPQSTPAKADQRRVVTPRATKPATAAKSRSKAIDVEPLEGLYDRRQVKLHQEVISDRRHVLDSRRRPAAKAYPICNISGVTYILNPNADVVIGLTRFPK